MFNRITIVLLFSFSLFGCSARHLSVSKVYIDKEKLASTFTRAPDPVQEKPPKGERLYISYLIPSSIAASDVELRLSVVWKNLEKEEVTFQPVRRAGMFSYSLLDSSYKSSGGIFTYKVDMVDRKGEVVLSYKQRMWVNVIKI